MPAEIEILWDAKEEGYGTTYRTSCQCTSEEHSIDFSVNVDVHNSKVNETADVGSAVWLEINAKSDHWSGVWDTPAWSRPFRTFWQRIKSCTTLMFKGYVEVHSSFIFRGDKQIDEFVETIIQAKNKAKENIKNG